MLRSRKAAGPSCRSLRQNQEVLGLTYKQPQVQVEDIWHRVSGEPLGKEGPLLLGQITYLFQMQPSGCSCFWPRHGFKVMKLRGKGIVYILGFQKLKNRAFSPSLKASQKEYSTSNEAAERKNSSRPATVPGQQPGLVARAILPPRHTWDSRRPCPSVPWARRSLGLPHSGHFRIRLHGRSGTAFCKRE